MIISRNSSFVLEQASSSVAPVNKSSGPTWPTSRFLRQSVHILGSHDRTNSHVILPRVNVLFVNITFLSVFLFFCLDPSFHFLTVSLPLLRPIFSNAWHVFCHLWWVKLSPLSLTHFLGCAISSLYFWLSTKKTLNFKNLSYGDISFFYIFFNSYISSIFILFKLSKFDFFLNFLIDQQKKIDMYLIFKTKSYNFFFYYKLIEWC